MKTLLTFIFCLLALAGNAATPPYTAFLGSNGITILSNLTSGKIIISGGGGISPGNSTNASGAVAFTNLMWSRTVFLDTNGNDTTALFGDATKPARTPLYAARLAWTNRPATVYGRPGTFTNGVAGTTLARDLVDWHLSTGCKLYQSNTFVLTNTGTVRGLFDDLDGSVRMAVWGGTLGWDGGVPLFEQASFSALPCNATIRGGIYLTNPASVVSVDVQRLEIRAYCQSPVFPSMIWQVNASNVSVRAQEIVDLGLDVVVQIGVDEFEEPVNVSSGVSGLYWELGEMYASIDTIRAALYPIYLSQPAGAAHSNNFWGRFQFIENRSGTAIYIAGGGTSTNWKSWVTADEVRGTLAAYGGGAFSGSHYFSMKKGSGLSGMIVGANAGLLYLWADVQKLTATASAAYKQENSSTVDSFVTLDFHELQNGGGATHGIDVTSGTLAASGRKIGHFTTARAVSSGGKLSLNLTSGTDSNSVVLTSGTYTNQGWETLVGIPNGAARTNKVVNLTNHLDRTITVFDAGGTATGTNIWIVGLGNQKFTGGASLTNIQTDYGSVTFRQGGTGGTNWIIVSAYP